MADRPTQTEIERRQIVDGSSSRNSIKAGGRERDARRRAAKPWRKLYQSAQWQAIRRLQLSRKPLCEWCEAKGRVRAAIVAHHAEPHKGDPIKFHTGNLISLCADCHDIEAQGIEARGYSNAIGADGWPLDKIHPSNRTNS